jgi:hypothetical protein
VGVAVRLLNELLMLCIVHLLECLRWHPNLKTADHMIRFLVPKRRHLNRVDRTPIGEKLNIHNQSVGSRRNPVTTAVRMDRILVHSSVGSNKQISRSPICQWGNVGKATARSTWNGSPGHRMEPNVVLN